MPQSAASSASLSTALPPKLVKKILELEFIDMAELIPNAWRYQEDDTTKCCHHSPKRGPVTDILLWVECFSILAGILMTKYPE